MRATCQICERFCVDAIYSAWLKCHACNDCWKKEVDKIYPDLKMDLTVRGDEHDG